VTFSPDGKRLVSCDNDAMIKIWDPATGRELLTLRGHRHEVAAAVFSPDNNLLATTSFDGAIKLWDAGLPAYPDTSE
jgi:WD40 repeat protein